MFGIDDRNTKIISEPDVDAPTRKMDTARPRHHLRVVTARTGNYAAGVSPVKKDTGVTILDKTNISPVRCSIAAAGSMPTEIRPGETANAGDQVRGETTQCTAGFTRTGLIAAGVCGLVVGLLWGRRSK